MLNLKIILLDVSDCCSFIHRDVRNSDTYSASYSVTATAAAVAYHSFSYRLVGFLCVREFSAHPLTFIFTDCTTVHCTFSPHMMLRCDVRHKIRDKQHLYTTEIAEWNEPITHFYDAMNELIMKDVFFINVYIYPKVFIRFFVFLAKTRPEICWENKNKST